MAKGFVEFDGLDPRTGQIGTFRLIREELGRISRYLPEAKLNDLLCVREIIQRPQAAFEGVRRIDERFGERVKFVELPDPHGLCMSGVPGKRLLKSGGFGRPPDGFTFAVFMDRRLTIWDWEWIESDRSNPAWPIGWVQRFDRVIWPKS